MKDLYEDWSEVKGLLLTGVPKHKQGYVGKIMEAQRSHLMEDAANGSVDTSAIAGFRKIMMPMIRRIIPNALGTEIVGVQPMTGPVGQVFSMRYTYKDDMPTVGGLGSPIDGTTNGSIVAGSEAFGNLNAIRRFYSGEADAYAGVGPAAGTNSYGFPNLSGTAQGVGFPSRLDASSVGPLGAAGPLHGGGGSYAEGIAGRRMGLELTSQAIEANTRKLQASWTVEAMQDLQNQHGLDIETELTRAISTQITQEIDNEILTDLLSIAGTTGTFNGSIALAAGAGYYKPTFAGDRLAGLGIQINVIANEIGRKTRKGPANFIVVSPMIVSALQTANKSVFAPATEGSFKGPNNTMLAGTLNGTIKVYTYIWNQVGTTDIGGSGDDVILIGFKGGDSETDAGYFYCPYVPLMSSGVIMDARTTQPMMSLMTRYGKAIFNDARTSLGNSRDYYGKLVVNDLELA